LNFHDAVSPQFPSDFSYAELVTNATLARKKPAPQSTKAIEPISNSDVSNSDAKRITYLILKRVFMMFAFYDDRPCGVLPHLEPRFLDPLFFRLCLRREHASTWPEPCFSISHF
jgi:hypothetical protein